MYLLPNLPTDNIYKFIALAGLVLTIFFFYYPAKVADELYTDIIKLETEQDMIYNKMRIYSLDSMKLANRIKILNLEADDLTMDTVGLGSKLTLLNLGTKFSIILDILDEIGTNQNKRDAFDFWMKYYDRFYPFTTINRVIDSLEQKMEKDFNQMSFDIIENHGNLSLIINKQSQHNFWWSVYWKGIILGLILMVCGFGLWYFKVQRKIDKKLSCELKEFEKRQSTGQEK